MRPYPLNRNFQGLINNLRVTVTVTVACCEDSRPCTFASCRKVTKQHLIHQCWSQSLIAEMVYGDLPGSWQLSQQCGLACVTVSRSRSRSQSRYIYFSIHRHVSMHTCTLMRIMIRVSQCVCVRMTVCIYVIHMSVELDVIHVCTLLYGPICIYTYIHTYIHTHTHTYIYMIQCIYAA